MDVKRKMRMCSYVHVQHKDTLGKREEKAASHMSNVWMLTEPAMPDLTPQST